MSIHPFYTSFAGLLGAAAALFFYKKVKISISILSKMDIINIII
jgi:hypothetical protein